jgi:hypothetical protein
MHDGPELQINSKTKKNNRKLTCVCFFFSLGYISLGLSLRDKTRVSLTEVRLELGQLRLLGKRANMTVTVGPFLYTWTSEGIFCVFLTLPPSPLYLLDLSLAS